MKILNAAHHAPSVGFSQPWNFIIIRNPDTRKKLKESFIKEHNRSITLLKNNKQKQKKYKSLNSKEFLNQILIFVLHTMHQDSDHS